MIRPASLMRVKKRARESFLDSWDREKVSETVSRRVAITADTKGFGVSIAWFNEERCLSGLVIASPVR